MGSWGRKLLKQFGGREPRVHRAEAPVLMRGAEAALLPLLKRVEVDTFGDSKCHFNPVKAFLETFATTCDKGSTTSATL